MDGIGSYWEPKIFTKGDYPNTEFETLHEAVWSWLKNKNVDARFSSDDGTYYVVYYRDF